VRDYWYLAEVRVKIDEVMEFVPLRVERFGGGGPAFEYSNAKKSLKFGVAGLYDWEVGKFKIVVSLRFNLYNL
jgi:hypothetical protein